MYGILNLIKSRDVVFIVDSESIENDLEMRVEEMEGHVVVVVDESSKSPLFNSGGRLAECNKQVKVICYK